MIGRFAKWLVGGAAALVLLTILAVWTIGPATLIRKAADMAGAGPVALEVTEWGWRGLVARQVSVGADKAVSAAELRLEFGIFGPLGGPSRAEITGLRVTTALGGGGSVAIPALSFPVVLNDTAIALADPGETYSAVAPGRVLLDKEASAGHVDLAITPREGGASAFMLHRGAIDLDKRAMTLTLAPVGAVARDKARLTLSARVQQGTGEGTGTGAVLALELRDVAFPALDLSLGTLALKGHVAADMDHVAFTLDECAQLTGLSAQRLVAEQLPVCPGTNGAPSVSVARGGDADERLALNVILRDAQARYLSRAGGALLSGTWPVIGLAGSSDAGLSNWQVRLLADGGDLRLGPGLALGAMTLSLESAMASGRLTRVDGMLASAQLSDPRAKPVLVPMTLSGSVKTADQGLVFTANGAGGGIAALLHAEGRYDLAKAMGAGTVALAPLAFDPAGLQPAALSPALAGQLSEARGRVAAEGRFSWDAKGLVSQGSLTLDKLAGKLALGRVEGLDGRIAFASLWPLATAAPQTVHVALLDLGLPLTEGQIRLSVERSGDLRIHEARWRWLGGTVELADGLLSPYRDTQSLTFAVSRIDLSQLLTLADVKGLSGTGTLSGRIPVTLEKGGHQPVHDGQLSAEAPGGTIVYKTGGVPSANPTEPSAILYTALDDFRYDSLVADISGDLAGTLSLRVHLKGRNPNLYDGRRIELNVSTDGAFVDMLRNGLYGYRTAVKPK